MPYCPKCDMEFVKGITVCTDCGGTLYESEEAAREALREAENKAMEEAGKEWARAFGTDGEEGRQAMEEAVSGVRKGPSQKTAPAPSAYVKKSSRYQDMKSSASAFLIIGCVLLAAAAASFIYLSSKNGGAYPAESRAFPAGVAAFIPSLAFCALGLVCLLVSFKTNRSAAAMKDAAAKENQETEELVSRFINSHTAEEIDGRLATESKTGNSAETPEACSPEELALKRYGLIQDYLITENDLPDPDYVDFLCEEIYNRMYGAE